MSVSSIEASVKVREESSFKVEVEQERALELDAQQEVRDVAKEEVREGPPAAVSSVPAKPTPAATKETTLEVEVKKEIKIEVVKDENREVCHAAVSSSVAKTKKEAGLLVPKEKEAKQNGSPVTCKADKNGESTKPSRDVQCSKIRRAGRVVSLASCSVLFMLVFPPAMTMVWSTSQAVYAVERDIVSWIKDVPMPQLNKMTQFRVAPTKPAVDRPINTTSKNAVQDDDASPTKVEVEPADYEATEHYSSDRSVELDIRANGEDHEESWDTGEDDTREALDVESEAASESERDEIATEHSSVDDSIGHEGEELLV
jgi:hypothetical protein